MRALAGEVTIQVVSFPDHFRPPFVKMAAGSGLGTRLLYKLLFSVYVCKFDHVQNILYSFPLSTALNADKAENPSVFSRIHLHIYAMSICELVY